MHGDGHGDGAPAGRERRGSLAALPWTRCAGSIRAGGSAGDVERYRERRLGDRGAGPGLELADRLGRSGRGDHRGQQWRGGGPTGRAVSRRRARHTDRRAPLDRPRHRRGHRRRPLGARGAPRHPACVAPPEEYVRVRDAGHRRRAHLRLLRQRRAVRPRHGRPPRVVAAARSRGDARGLGHGGVAGAARQPGLPRQRQR